MSEAISDRRSIKVVVWDAQPIAVNGIKMLLESQSDLAFRGEATDFRSLRLLLEHGEPDVLVLDRALTEPIVNNAIQLATTVPKSPHVVIWGAFFTDYEILRFMKAGARGVIPKTVPLSVILICLREAAAGRIWVEKSNASEWPETPDQLTSREEEVFDLIVKGFKNKEIASKLGIAPGTVKLHAKHIFDKTGCRGRYRLAIENMHHNIQAAAVAS